MSENRCEHKIDAEDISMKDGLASDTVSANDAIKYLISDIAQMLDVQARRFFNIKSADDKVAFRFDLQMKWQTESSYIDPVKSTYADGSSWTRTFQRPPENAAKAVQDLYERTPATQRNALASLCGAAYMLENASEAFRQGRYRLALFYASSAQTWADSCASQIDIPSDIARRSAEMRRKIDPRTSEKEFVHDCWRRWRLNPDAYRSKAEFARDMLEKCEHLKSQKKIEDWCREWEKLEPN